MANTFKFVNWLTMEGLRILINKSQVAQFFNTSYNKEFTREFAVGETVEVKYPQRFLIRNGLGYSPQPIARKSTTVNVDQIFGIDFEWDSVEKALNAERGEDAIRKEYLEPAMAQIASELDSRCANYALLNTPHIVGALGTNPTATSTYQKARTRLFQLACPPGEKGMIVSPSMMESLVTANSGLSGWFNPPDEISKAFKEGAIGKAAGFNWYESNNLYSLTSGTEANAAAMQVYTAPVSGATQVTIAGGAGDTYKKGESINFALAYETNPQNRRSIGVLKEFVVTEDLTLVGDNSDVLKFWPPIEGPGSQYQNVSALPAAGAVIIRQPGTTSPSGKSGVCGLALHQDAFALVGVKLETPKAVELASQTRDPETGISIRFIRQFDPNTSKMINRFDVLLGFGRLYADHCAVKVASLT